MQFKACLLACLSCMPALVSAEAVPVELRQTEAGWQLLRGGEPYLIRGAGGDASLELLAEAGANSVRIWSADGAGEILDKADTLGMTVTVGIWLGHERHGFDYNDPAQVKAQFQRAREAIIRYKDHPALLLWGIGNEMEGYESGDDPVIWAAVNDIAAMAKELDPAHPTMTVTAEIGGGRIDSVHRRAPAIDIHGINSYGGAPSLPARLRAGGATKPYVITEFGPVGPWEMPKTDWGAPYEQTSTDKAAFYRRSYTQGVTGAPGIALGSYAFLWGHKMETTETWFGMFLEDGSPTAAVEVMTELWSGSRPADLAPTVEPLLIDGRTQVDPGAEVRVHAVAADPEGGPLKVRWVLRPESGETNTGGDFRPNLPEIENAILAGDVDDARVRMPDDPGGYRLFFYAYDEAGNAATANVPLWVKGEVRTRFPIVVYEDGFEGMRWVPSGWMGGVESLSLDGENVDNPQSGNAAIRIRYDGEYGWAGIAWQHPANNWGTSDGGYDLVGATALEVWARGAYGGEKIKLGAGLLGPETDFPDSGIASIDGIVLTREWQRYRIPLQEVDLSSIKTGFVVTVVGRASPVTIYLDRIRYVR